MASSSAPAGASTFTNMTLKAMLSRWRDKLEGLERDFASRAAQVNHYDEELRRTRFEHFKLKAEVDELESGARELEDELARVKTEQGGMDSTLASLEEHMERLLPADPAGGQADAGSYGATAQRQRADAYEAAGQLNALLHELEARLQSVDRKISEGERFSADGARDDVSGTGRAQVRSARRQAWRDGTWHSGASVAAQSPAPGLTPPPPPPSPPARPHAPTS